MAQYLGARPESLSRAFAELARRQVIEALDGRGERYRILDPQRLLEISGQELGLDPPPRSKS
nr:helix-turn-helix domain-containing protein [Cereibacter changlensis]